MNERIKELLKKATRRVDREDREWVFSEVDQKKFAELIVRECIDIAQDRANFPGYPPNDVNYIIDEIREHFGVEE